MIINLLYINVLLNLYYNEAEAKCEKQGSGRVRGTSEKGKNDGEKIPVREVKKFQMKQIFLSNM